jgi:hypothetical protein
MFLISLSGPAAFLVPADTFNVFPQPYNIALVDIHWKRPNEKEISHGNR